MGQRTSLSNEESTEDLLMNAVRTHWSLETDITSPGVREGDQLWCPLEQRFKKQTGVRQGRRKRQSEGERTQANSQ